MLFITSLIPHSVNAVGFEQVGFIGIASGVFTLSCGENLEISAGFLGIFNYPPCLCVLFDF